MTAITYEELRGRGFRLLWPEIDGRPRMLLRTNAMDEQALEMCPMHDGDWHCWLRLDSSHQRAKFVHVRHFRHLEDLDNLILGVTGKPSVREVFDVEQFRARLAEMQARGEENWKRYCDRGIAQDCVARFL